MKKLDKFNVMFFWLAGCIVVLIAAIGFMLPGFFSVMGMILGIFALMIAPPILFVSFWNRYIAKE